MKKSCFNGQDLKYNTSGNMILHHKLSCLQLIGRVFDSEATCWTFNQPTVWKIIITSGHERFVLKFFSSFQRENWSILLQEPDRKVSHLLNIFLHGRNQKLRLFCPDLFSNINRSGIWAAWRVVCFLWCFCGSWLFPEEVSERWHHEHKNFVHF